MSRTVLIEIKAWERDKKLLTAYGRITQLDWLTKECERISAEGGVAEIVQDEVGYKLVVETTGSSSL